jgi:hypothetical protein
MIFRVFFFETPLRLGNLLHLVARTADGETLFIKKVSYSADHEHFVVLVIPAIAAALDGSKLCELLLPISKHMRLDTTKFAHFTNGEVALGGYRWEGVLH